MLSEKKAAVIAKFAKKALVGKHGSKIWNVIADIIVEMDLPSGFGWDENDHEQVTMVVTKEVANYLRDHYEGDIE